MLVLGVILVVLGHAWALIPMFMTYLIVYFISAIVKARADVRHGKQVDGFNVCHHNYQHIKTEKYTYGINNGVQVNTVYTYQCTKCGQIITKNK